MTASRALNAPARVSAAVRARVEQACRDLAYQPNRAASALAGARSRLVVAVAPAWEDPAVAALLEGASHALAALGYATVPVRLPAPGHAAGAAALQPWLAYAPDGIVFAGTHPDADMLVRLQQHDLPWTQAGAGPTSAGPIAGAGAGPRAQAIGQCAIAHLHARGYRRVGIVCAQGELGAIERADAALRAMQAHGLAAEPQRVAAASEPPSPELGAALAQALLQTTDCDALFLTHDLLAWGALHHCRQRDPDGVWSGALALVGVHDLPASRWLHPALSSVDTRPQAAGEQAARELIERVEGPARKAHWFDTGCAMAQRQSSQGPGTGSPG